jgi:Sec-independent protein translocase protein TatA
MGFSWKHALMIAVVALVAVAIARRVPAIGSIVGL